MKDCRGPNVSRANVLRVLCKDEKRIFGRLKQGSVTLLWMRTHKGSKLSWHSEGEHKVCARQLLLELLLQPEFGFTALADRTMPVSTGFQDMMQLLALLASINDAASVFGSATHDRNHGLDLIGMHLNTVLL
jgi:hypothetical protein